jgi:hypothetical protein
MRAGDLSAAFSLRHASAGSETLPARARAEEGLKFSGVDTLSGIIAGRF